MKKLFLVFSMLIFLAGIISFASADVVQNYNIYKGELSNTETLTNEAVEGAFVAGYICSDRTCNSIERTWFSDRSISSFHDINDNSISILYPRELQGGEGSAYILFFYKEGYYPSAYSFDWAGGGNNEVDRGNYDVYLYKKQNAEAKLGDLQMSNEFKVDEEITANLVLHSPIDYNLNFDLPSYIEDQLLTRTIVNLEVLNSNDEIVESSTQSFDLMPSETREVSFSFDLSEAGDYSITFTSDIVDNKVETKTSDSLTRNIKIISDEILDTISPVVTISLPKDGNEYTYEELNEIRFEVSENAYKYFFNLYFFVNSLSHSQKGTLSQLTSPS